MALRWVATTRTLVGLVLLVLVACTLGRARAAELRDPCGPLTGPIAENWARPATPAEQARVEELRQACRRAQRTRSTAARTQATPEPPCDGAEPTPRIVTRVVDGDTIVLDGGEKVRLIGVDTPETVDPASPSSTSATRPPPSPPAGSRASRCSWRTTGNEPTNAGGR